MDALDIGGELQGDCFSLSCLVGNSTSHCCGRKEKPKDTGQ